MRRRLSGQAVDRILAELIMQTSVTDISVSNILTLFLLASLFRAISKALTGYSSTVSTGGHVKSVIIMSEHVRNPVAKFAGLVIMTITPSVLSACRIMII